jgi:hypothetical protein
MEIVKKAGLTNQDKRPRIIGFRGTEDQQSFTLFFSDKAVRCESLAGPGESKVG